MEYFLLRKKFCEMSGRYDLMNTDYTDNGADFFINAGQQELDRLQNTGKVQAKHVQAVTAGSIKIYIDGLRSVLDVWIGNTTDGLYRLKNAQTLSYLKELYQEDFTTVDQGDPEWYCPVIFRPYPDSITGATWTSSFYDIGDMIFPGSGGVAPTHYANSGIIIMPPPSTTFYVQIYGLFYSPTLLATLGANITSGTLVTGTTYLIANWISDDDFSNVGGTNEDLNIFTATGTTPTHWTHSSVLNVLTRTRSFWSEVYPQTLLKAALKQLEIFYRNSEGVKDWNSALTSDTSGMDMDAAEEEAAGISQMGG